MSEDHLFVHLRMSGDLYIREKNAAPDVHDRLLFYISARACTERSRSDGGVSSLVFNDTRKFGRVWLVRDPQEVVGGLGPEPLSEDFTAQVLYERLRFRRRQLKPLLLDQSFLAGLGNIYTDEALHRARLHPLAASDAINREQAEALWEAIREVLEEGIRRNGASIDWAYRGGEFQNYFRVYDRKGQPCPVCGTSIERLVVGQRGTHICPNCQRIGS
jgi:formamidopyrimidine-DNA glycosylase